MDQNTNSLQERFGLTNAFEAFKVFAISKQISKVSAARDGPNKVHDLFHIYIHMH